MRVKRFQKSGLTDRDALVIVDVQNDFLPGGALAVPLGDEIISVLNEYLHLFTEKGLPIFATRDWHPENHCSFQDQGGHWPPHCLAKTTGAGFAPGLDLPTSAKIVSKATSPGKDAYSGFQGTNLHTQLRSLGVKRLFTGGLATDYCVLNTVKDALRLGYRVNLLLDTIRAVNIKAGDGDRAIASMIDLGAIPISQQKWPHRYGWN